MDATTTTEVIALVKSVMGLFAEFPLNIILTSSLAGVGFSVFKKAKRAAK